MAWVWVMVATAVGGLVMLAWFARWLWHKAGVLMDELGRLAEVADDAFALVDGVDAR